MKRLLKIKCIYCGQKILAGDDKMGTKAHCPKCNHVIFINDSALLDKKPEEPTEGDTDLLVDKSAVERKERVDKYRAKEMQKGYFRKWFAPEFDDLSMFLMVVAAVLVLATNLNIGSNIAKFVQAISDIEPGKDTIIMLGIVTFILLGGAMLPIFHVFSKREKYEWEKVFMLISAVIFSAGSGIFAGHAMLKEAGQGFGGAFNSKPWFEQLGMLIGVLKLWAVFPLWNIANGILMLVLLRTGIITTECIADKDVKFWELLLSLVILTAVFVVCQYGFKTHWAVTYSICIVYSTNFVKWGGK